MALRRLLFFYDCATPPPELIAQLTPLPVEIDSMDYSGNPVARLQTLHYDLIIVLATAGAAQGRRKCAAIRTESAAPIILIAPMEDVHEVLQALQQDVDVALPMPVNPSVVAGHAAALLRRVSVQGGTTPTAPQGSGQFYADPGLFVDLIRRRVLVHGQRVRLTPTEFRLLALLARYPNQVLTYDQILKQVWGWEVNDHRLVHTFMAQLRSKFGKSGAHYFDNEYGIGYRFVPQPQTAADTGTTRITQQDSRHS